MNNNNYPNYYQQSRPMAQPTIYGLKGRPVSSLDEVRATSIDFDGSIFFFPDLANKRIYTKQINMDGTAVLNMYELKEIPASQPNAPIGDFITRQEFEEAIAAIKNALLQQQSQTVERLKSDILNF